MMQIELLIAQIREEYFKSNTKRDDKLCDCKPDPKVKIDDDVLRCPICRRQVEIEIIK